MSIVCLIINILFGILYMLIGREMYFIIANVWFAAALILLELED